MNSSLPPARPQRQLPPWLASAGYALILETALFLAMLHFNIRTGPDHFSAGWAFVLTQLPGVLAGQLVSSRFAETSRFGVGVMYVVIFLIQWLTYYLLITSVREIIRYRRETHPS